MLGERLTGMIFWTSGFQEDGLNTDAIYDLKLWSSQFS